MADAMDVDEPVAPVGKPEAAAAEAKEPEKAAAGDDAPADGKQPEEEQDSAPVIAEGFIAITPDGGIQKKILREAPAGARSPPDGADVECHYVGTLMDNGEKFDSSRDRDSPFNFPIGQGRVIKGWDQGIATMKKGELAILRCQSDYAYGDSGSPPKIPPGATLDFEVELLDFDDWKKVGGGKDVMKRVLVEAAKSWDNPGEDAKAIVSFKGRYGTSDEEAEQTLFHSGDDVEVIVDETEGYPEGFWTAIKELGTGETSTFRLRSKVAFGEAGQPELGVPPHVDVYYTMTLHSFERAKALWDLKTFAEHVEAAEKQRQKGNELFKAKRLEKAAKKYDKAVETLEHDSDFSDEEKAEASKTKALVQNNLALVYLKTQEFGKAHEQAEKVVEFDAENVKGWTRKGHANLELGNHKEAKKDLQQALKLDPENVYVQKLLKSVKKKIKAYKQKERRMYGNMFK